MNVGPEKALVTIIIISFVFSSVNTLVLHDGLLTKEEAIEISRNSKLVVSLMENADRYVLEVHYQNKTQTGLNHGMWQITWYIHIRGTASASADVVGHAIDEETGSITSEGHLIAM